ncbi:MAG TPA: hypothetical protein PK513_06830 [Alphaproteobacteria bacterium]|nr:hypothetical protein [Alphaproteobacteria bacterium]USO05574.1 MAG: hypothetical protein H6859_10705 [Rhodospirillales bacterium]HOO82199.1 hypothetical protein [Alphaproteobacteria bacterium]
MSAFYPLEYLSVLKRQKLLFFTIFGSILFVSFLFVAQWSKYRAFATVEVVPPEIAIDAVESPQNRILTAEAMADLQISRLKQKVLSTSSLADIVTKLNLYPKARAHTPIAYIAKNMQRKIDIHLMSTVLANPASAQKVSAFQLSAIAFTLSFEYSDPFLAQKTVNELVSRFLDEDLKDRRETAQKTSEFLEGQIEILSATLEEQEQKIAEFQAAHGVTRPDALGFNQQASITTSSRLLAIESELISNLGLIGALRAQLVQTDPYSRVVDEGGEVLSTPAIQLRALKSQYATLSAKYGPAHPDVLKVSRQINALKNEISPVNLSARLKAKITDMKAKLSSAEKTYGSAHPDYISLQNQLQNLEDQLENVQNDAASLVKDDADNPAYLQIVVQINAAEKQREALEAQRDAVKSQQEEFRKAVADNPVAEQKMAALARDYDNMMFLYRDLKARKLAADMSKTIEEGHVGRRLAVIDPPELPLGTSPSKKLILAGGFVFALMAGLGSIIGLQILSQTVIGPHHLESLIGSSPLITVPHLFSLEEKIKARRLIIKLLVVAPFVAAVPLILISFKPL